MRKINNLNDILKEAFNIFKNNLLQSFFMFLSSIIPVIGDSLHTCIVEQIFKKEEISARKALLKALGYFWNLLEVIILFTISMTLWIFVPIYGWIKAVYYSLYSAMISNVVILEGMAGKKAMQRCREIIMRNKESQSLAIGFFVGFPLIISCVFILIGFISSLHNNFNLKLTNIIMIVLSFIFLSVFEIGNSLIYYELIKRELEDGVASPKVKELLESKKG
ncbi:MAG: hypothetical protein HYU63_05320 [Armatimonadetes bacterium]|nr:hypothetical protein [Armatimonadota bacterium]